MRTLWIALVLALVLPAASFWGVGVAEGLSTGEASEALVAQLGGTRLNPAILGAVNLLPLLLLALVLYIARRRGLRGPRHSLLLGLGVAPVLVIELWAQLSYWPLYLPEQEAPGFPHGLELMLGPVVYAPVVMLIAVGVGAALSRGLASPGDAPPPPPAG